MSGRREHDFQAALADALDERGWKPTDLARALGVSAEAVRLWLNSPKLSIKPENVFAIELAIGVPPGSLSRLLGYLPVDAVAATDIEDAIRADPELRRNAEVIIAAIRQARELHKQRGR